MEVNDLEFCWKFIVKAKPVDIWAKISDTNLIFEYLKLPSVRQTSLSRSAQKQTQALTYQGILSYQMWEEEPYHWEHPYRFGTTRHYKIGFLKKLRFYIDLNRKEKHTEIEINIYAELRNRAAKPLIAFYFSSVIKPRLKKGLDLIEKSLHSNKQPYEFRPAGKFHRNGKKKLENLRAKLIKKTRRPRIVNRLLDYISKAEEHNLQQMHPYALAEYWGEKKYAVLSVFLHAVKLEILDFKWNVACSHCRSTVESIHSIANLRTKHVCSNCKQNFEVDFNNNLQMVYNPHPLIKKIGDKSRCFGGPQLKPHVFCQHMINPGQTAYFKLKLLPGTYKARTNRHNDTLRLQVEEEANNDTISIIYSDEQPNPQTVGMSDNPNLSVKNTGKKPILFTLEKVAWKEEALFASEISSLFEFRSLFPDEMLRENERVKAKDLTILFTDLLNSTAIYLEQGEENAVGQVMSHFKILQQIMAEERGAIVKTIGDSVMAVFHHPNSALRAIERIQTIFSSSSSLGSSFKLKAGIHIGDCTAVSLNNRVDFFGTTVNIASRLVDIAKEREIVISTEVYDHPDVRRYLQEHKEQMTVRDSHTILKGFETEDFPVKQICLGKPNLRLVV